MKLILRTLILLSSILNGLDGSAQKYINHQVIFSNQWLINETGDESNEIAQTFSYRLNYSVSQKLFLQIGIYHSLGHNAPDCIESLNGMGLSISGFRYSLSNCEYEFETKRRDIGLLLGLGFKFLQTKGITHSIVVMNRFNTHRWNKSVFDATDLAQNEIESTGFNKTAKNRLFSPQIAYNFLFTLKSTNLLVGVTFGIPNQYNESIGFQAGIQF